MKALEEIEHFHRSINQTLEKFNDKLVQFAHHQNTFLRAQKNTWFTLIKAWGLFVLAFVTAIVAHYSLPWVIAVGIFVIQPTISAVQFAHSRREKKLHAEFLYTEKKSKAIVRFCNKVVKTIHQLDERLKEIEDQHTQS